LTPDPTIDDLVTRMARRRRRDKVSHALCVIAGGVIAVLGILVAAGAVGSYEDHPETWFFVSISVAFVTAISLAILAIRAEIESGELAAAVEKLSERVQQLEQQLPANDQLRQKIQVLSSQLDAIQSSQRSWWPPWK